MCLTHIIPLLIYDVSSNTEIYIYVKYTYFLGIYDIILNRENTTLLIHDKRIPWHLFIRSKVYHSMIEREAYGESSSLWPTTAPAAING